MRGNDLTLCEWNYLLDNKQELTFVYTNWKTDIVTGKQIGRAHV